MIKKITNLILNILPISIMIWLIPIVKDDYLLTLFYVVIILVSLFIKKYNKDATVFILGFFVMLFCEYIFLTTKVEVFERNSLLGIMPLWLPFLWGYGFVTIRRVMKIFDL